MATPDTLQFLAAHEVFTVDEFRTFLGPRSPEHSAPLRLAHAVERGWVERVTRGLYVSRVGLFADRRPDPLVVGSKLAPDATLVFHSALEAHGVAHSLFSRVTVTSARAPRTLTSGTIEYRRLRERPQLADPDVGAHLAEVSRRVGERVRVSSRERTLVDCLDRPDLAGGLEEALRGVGAFPSFRLDQVLEYLDLLASPTLTARVGWVLFTTPDQWHLTGEDQESFRERLGRGPYYLGRSRRAVRFVPHWRLYVPDDLDAEGLLSPELLFAEWPEVLARARLDPVMARKVENLQGRSGCQRRLMPRIAGSTVTLRPAREADRRAIYEWLAHSDVTASMMGPPRYPEVPPPTWEEFSRDYVPGMFDGSTKDVAASCVIEADGEAVGQINYEIREAPTLPEAPKQPAPLEAPDTPLRVAELDIWLRSEAHTGHGYGPDALNAIVEHLATAYGVGTFVIRPSARNPRAIRAYEKAGFSRVAMTQEEQADRFGPGDYSDTVLLVRAQVSGSARFGDGHRRSK